jgi:hypothetical protein
MSPQMDDKMLPGVLWNPKCVIPAWRVTTDGARRPVDGPTGIAAIAVMFLTIGTAVLRVSAPFRGLPFTVAPARVSAVSFAGRPPPTGNCPLPCKNA